MFYSARLGHGISHFFKVIAHVFAYFGHIFYSVFQIIKGELPFSWYRCARTIYSSGATLVLPLSFVCAIMGVSLSFNLHELLSGIGFESSALIASQRFIAKDLLPAFIALILCTQSAVELVGAKIKKIQHAPHDVLVDYILPIIIGLSFSSLLLYAYTLFVTMIAIYFTFADLLHTNIHEFYAILIRAISLRDLFTSVAKVLLFSTIVSLIVGYYYYQLASWDVSLRNAVGRIITRGLLWVLLSGATFNIIMGI